MRILFLTPQLPYPPDKGTRIRNFGMIKELAQRHDVGVISFAEPGDEDARAKLEAHCRVLGLFPRPERSRMARAWRTVIDPIPDLARRLESRTLSARGSGALADER